MRDQALDRIEAIHSMLSAGQRPVRMERAGLVTWGLVMGGLAAGLEPAVEQLGHLDHVTVAFVVTGALAAGGALAAVIDRKLTQRVRARRGESIAFAERQIAKAWILLIALGIVLTFATFFFGGSPMLYAVWVVLLGVGLFLHGLFSEQLPEWVGVAMILLGVLPLAVGASYCQTRWIAAAACGVGLPLLAAMLDGGMQASLTKRLTQSLGWLAAVLGAAFVAWDIAAEPIVRNAPVISLDQFLTQREPKGAAIVHVPAGVQIPLTLSIRGDIFAAEQDAHIALTLQRPLDFLTADGAATGYSRVAGDAEWRRGTLAVNVMHPEVRGDAAHLFLGGSLAATFGRAR